MNLRCTEYDTSLTSTQEPFTPGVPSDRAAGCVLEGWLRPGWLVRMESRCNAISALLVHDERSHLSALGAILSEQLLAEVNHVRDCEEASIALNQRCIPYLVFTDTKLPDGSWEDILKLAATSTQAVNVFVVSRVGNIGLYTEAMMRGAFDFITPNIPPAAFVEVLRTAMEDVYRRRQSRAVI